VIPEVRALKQRMDRLAVQTWRKIEVGGKLNLSFAETSITDHNLFVLANRHPWLRVHKFTQSRESTVGADWEWFIGAQQTGWLCLRIQAKRVYDGRYRELTHPGHGEDSYQYDTLIAGCTRGEIPLHVFYNGWDADAFATGSRWPGSSIWRACPRGNPPDHCSHAKPRDYGCAVASSYAVKQVHENRHRGTNRRIQDHLSNAVPWSYLLGYPPADRVRVVGAPARAARLSPARRVAKLEAWMGRVQATLHILAQPELSPEPWAHLSDVMPDLDARRERLPDYAEAVRTGEALDTPGLTGEHLPAAPLTLVLDATEL
jgi:hypothetical protein